jgi:hypothetical protein
MRSALSKKVKMKDFRHELLKFRARLKRGEPFALSRFGDGESAILMNGPIETSEYRYDPQKATDFRLHKQLLESFCYKHCQYYVGISCPECIGMRNFRSMKKKSGQGDDHLTFACLFVDFNYSYFKRFFLPLFKEYEVILVCNEDASLKTLPFVVKKEFRVSMNAWKRDRHLIRKIHKYIEERKIRRHLFLLCAGPFSCILAHQLHSFCPDNFYIDIGSVLDPFFFEEFTRGYMTKGSSYLKKACYWV